MMRTTEPTVRVWDEILSLMVMVSYTKPLGWVCRHCRSDDCRHVDAAYGLTEEN